jgi:hypothetical protein
MMGDEVLSLAGEGNTGGVIRLLRDATPQQRKEVAAAVKAQVAGMDQWAAWQRRYEMQALLVAGAGSLATAAQVATWLNRRSFGMVELDVPSIAAVLTDRDVTWLPDLAQRLAGRMTERNRTPESWGLVAHFVRALGLPPPTGDQFVLGWLESVFRWDNLQKRGAREALRDDPFLDHLLPYVFEVDGAGTLMNVGSWVSNYSKREKPDLGVLAFASLADEGRVSRDVLLDGCLSRFLKGDRPGALGVFVTLHDGLAPTLDEVAARQEDYARLLPTAPSPVAILAQKALRALDDAGRLDPEVLVQGGRDVLFRSERGLVRTQLTWLDRAAKRDPTRAGDILQAVAVAFGHPALDLQERALNIMAKHVEACDTDARAALADAATVLDADLGARAAQLFGTATDAAPAAATVDLPTAPAAAPVWRPMPAPIASPAELAAELTALVGRAMDPVGFERVLAAFVSLANDRGALRDALTPVVDRLAPGGYQPDLDEVLLDRHLLEVARTLCRTSETPGWRAALKMMLQLVGVDDRRKRSRATPAPHRMLVMRLAEIGHHLDRRPVPALVATPTATTGHIDPAVLVDRVAAAERDDWQPWPVDLAQALLRLPRTADPDVVARAAALTSPAGRRLAERLATGPYPDPAEVPIMRKRARDWWAWHQAGNVADMPIVELIPDAASNDPLIDPLFRNRPTGYWQYNVTRTYSLWPAVLPSHREVVAAHLLPDIADGPQFGSADPDAALPTLAEGSGPCGPAMAAAVAYTLGSARERTRVTGVDTALTLAATGDLDSAAVGEAVAAHLRAGVTKIVWLTPALTELANAGQPTAVWAIASRALAVVLALPKALPGTADLLALASKVVAGRPGLTPLPELAPVAARTGNSRLVTEARRLQRLLPEGTS